ncbi:MAG: CHAT domain-containing protein [Caldilineaceae bacterium]
MKTVVLHIGPLDPAIDGYPVTALEMGAPGGVAQQIAAGVLPRSLQPPGINPLFTVDEMRARFAAAGQPDEGLAEIGAQLYALLAPAPIDAYMQTLTDNARIVLEIEPPDLQPLPWELLCRNQVFLFPNADIPFCRGVGQPLAPLPEHDWPLRLLVIVGSKEAAKEAAATPQNDEVQAEAELESMYDALVGCEADVDFLVLKRQSKAEIVRQLREFKPHILHFIGHGGVKPDDTAFLEFYNEQSKTKDFWEPTIIRNDLVGLEKTLRLAFLNACRSDAAGKDGLWSVTNAFVEAGVPAVLGMRTEIAGDDAGRFAGAFYHMLANGAPIDTAVAEARRQVHEPLTDGLKRREWASPCLQVQAAPSTIIQIGTGVDENHRKLVRRVREFIPLRQLVDRRHERWQAWQRLRQQRPQNLLVITGESGVGKTKFVHMLMERCALCKHEIRYVNMKERGIDYLTLLRAIRDGEGRPGATVLTKPLPAADVAFAQFNRQVNQALTVVGFNNNGAPEDRDWLQPIREELYEEGQADQLFRAFRSGLEQVAAVNPPLVLVLDHLEAIAAHQFIDYINPFLFAWINQMPNVYVILLLTRQQFADYKLREIDVDLKPMELDLFKLEEWENLAMEFLRRMLKLGPTPVSLSTAEDLQAARDFVTNSGKLLINKPFWAPIVLEKFGAFYESATRGR